MCEMSIPNFTDLNELAAAGNGGKILFATDDWFAPAENMIKDSEPIFIADKYTEYGKWMDGWETRRKRIPGHDWCILKLGAPCRVRGFHVDTAFFTGNYAPWISVQSVRMLDDVERFAQNRGNDMIGTACSENDLNSIQKVHSDEWTEILPKTKLKDGSETFRHNFIEIQSDLICTHLRINMYPDGGIARFRVYGDVQPNLTNLMKNSIVDLIALENGGQCIDYSNAHYGHPRNLIKPGRGVNMGDGWETARRLDRPAILEADNNGILKVPGCEYAIFKLAARGRVTAIEVDTKHFKGNFPDSVKIEGTNITDSAERVEWNVILDSQKLSADKRHFYEGEIRSEGPFNAVKVTIAPDGGISRLRLFGTIQ